jgi:predicted O-linked N-acetylglucosamine transferase (SPINDLY family)
LCLDRGRVLIGLERFDDAIAELTHAVALAPNEPDAHAKLGLAYESAGRNAEAVASCQRAIALDPNQPEALNTCGLALRDLGRPDEALAYFDRAIAIKADCIEALNNRAVVCVDKKRFVEALEASDRGIAAAPERGVIHYTRALALEGLGRLAEAIDSFDHALALEPNMPLAPGKRLHARMTACRWDGIEALFADIRRKVEAGIDAISPFAILTVPASAALQRRATETNVAKQIIRAPRVRTPARPRGQKLRIGYFSSDYYNHATSYLIAGIIEGHDRTRFDIFGFSLRPLRGDAMGQRMQAAFGEIIDATTKSDADIAALARAMNIDIAVDLKGHTMDARPGIFVHGAAPIQVNYLGHPGTMGMPSIDYIIADRVIIPPEHRAHYVENVVTMPHSYQANDSKRQMSDRRYIRAELGLPAHGFVFCSFNNSYKITPDAFDIWMRLLQQVDGSVLWLLANKPLMRDYLRKEAQARGVAPTRLVFAEAVELPEHLARLRAADLFLDSFHYNAHTTASDALWVDLPLVTKLGGTFASRVAASLLTAAGLPDLITHTAEDYEALALRLATTPALLAEMKQRLSASHLTCPLFDTARFTRNIEAAYDRMWEIYVATGGAAPFEVTDVQS